MVNITDYNVYNTGMSKSYDDKLFAIDKISGISSIIDFGCADGTLINHMRRRLYGVKMVGFDIDSNMIALANKNAEGLFTTDYTTALNAVKTETAMLNLSSVIHEVYTYSIRYAIDDFWNDVFSNGFKYVAIRDFCVASSINRQADINDYTKVIKKGNPEQIKEFESVWGSLRENRNLVHFLMKYRYLENWSREVRENYFPVTLEQLLSNIPTNTYEIVYFEDYVLPFTYEKVKEDFDIEIHDNTHVKILLRRKNGGLK